MMNESQAREALAALLKLVDPYHYACGDTTLLIGGQLITFATREEPAKLGAILDFKHALDDCRDVFGAPEEMA